MNLAHLLAPYADISSDIIVDVDVKGFVTDNRDVTAGDCFIALAGITHHGKEFIDDAVSRGAIAVLIDSADLSGLDTDKCSQGSIPCIGINNLTHHVNNLVFDFYRQENSIDDLRLMAVTGTNGKSSITRFAAQMSHRLNHPTGLMGTLGFGVWPTIVESKNTTPELAVLLRQFCLMKEQGVQQVMMEVSSHGIAQKRIEGLTFETAVFSNLTQDHLDYHGDMETYYSIKRAIFLTPTLTHAIINIDDEYGQRLMNDTAISAQKISYGFSESADVRVIEWSSNGSSINASIATPWGDAHFTIGMVGDFNLANVLAAISLLALEGVDSFSDIISSVASITPAPGRMESYCKDGSATVVIDFAHTPAALHNVLSTLKKDIQKNSKARLAVVLGCGGDRDTDKRPKMAGIAESIADRVIFTSDNPRTEKVENIIHDMSLGLQSNKENKERVLVSVELDRAKAIESALSELDSHDVLLVAGKGHEDFQDINGVKIPYCDEHVLLSLGYRVAKIDVKNNKTHISGGGVLC